MSSLVGCARRRRWAGRELLPAAVAATGAAAAAPAAGCRRGSSWVMIACRVAGCHIAPAQVTATPGAQAAARRPPPDAADACGAMLWDSKDGHFEAGLCAYTAMALALEQARMRHGPWPCPAGAGCCRPECCGGCLRVAAPGRCRFPSGCGSLPALCSPPQIIQHLRHYSEPVFQVRHPAAAAHPAGRCCLRRTVPSRPHPSPPQQGCAPGLPQHPPAAHPHPQPHHPMAMQRYIVRIIFMVPMYSICSFPSLIHPNQAIYWNTVRDWCAPPPAGRPRQPAAPPGGPV